MSEEKLGQHYLAALNEAFPGVVLDHAWQTKCNQVNHLIPTRVLVKGGEITCKILK
ncbi:fe(3+) ions import ATP-binding FbpC domain protein [Escherichia coli 3-073-06_S3_C2]|nr:fe(3+) ions import ATP-binding FbpC domain protein [Escherichia coli 3-073-06_S3_C2]